MKVTYQQLADMTGKHKNTIIARLRKASITFKTEGPGFPKYWDSADALKVIYKAEFKQSIHWWR